MRAVVDATHPFAARISANAVKAAEAAGVPLASLIRPAWTRQEGDRWISVPTPEAAAEALGPKSAHRLSRDRTAGAAGLCRAPRTIITSRASSTTPATWRCRQTSTSSTTAARSTPPPSSGSWPNGASEIVVSKNSGGAATYGKIEAARALSLPVVMIERPDKPAGRAVGSASEALRRLESLLHKLLRARRIDEGRAARPLNEPRAACADDDERAHVGGRGFGFGERGQRDFRISRFQQRARTASPSPPPFRVRKKSKARSS